MKNLSVKQFNGVPQIVFNQNGDLSRMRINKTKKFLHVLGIICLCLFMLSAMTLLPVGDYLKGTIWVNIDLCVFAFGWLDAFVLMYISSEMNDYIKA